MQLEGPHRYKVEVREGGGYAIHNSNGGRTFLAPATLSCPKLYVFASEDRLIYVGQTVQRMSDRIRQGFQADGDGGYYGYRWRKELQTADLLVWQILDARERDLECIESEIVFMYRQQVGQWPRFQTEIHFHESTPVHRELAQKVFGFFR